MITTVNFRGEQRQVSFEVVDEPEVNVKCVDDWGFVGLSPEEHDALVITEAEDEDICNQLWEFYDNHDPRDIEPPYLGDN